ncbi:Cytochrome c oxidase biogenesis protein Cmc1-like [Zostera marina]|uniref:COX assembly mitochondrial protein n=1 Tax=Zostera marina TaxID=29655 RepID=A0A0K9PHG7_ZOSMR|nr:Cytochrome c oxidase biogenesis protein Cmc1-like [Zostera marina]
MGFAEQARENHVKKKVEEALRSKMKKNALKMCNVQSKLYAECAAGRTISVVWHCRKQAKELNSCLHQYTNDLVLEEMKMNYMQEEDNKVRS